MNKTLNIALSRLEREREALQRDKVYREKKSHTLEDFIADNERYPSVVTRIHDRYNAVRRFVRDIADIPYRTKMFIHRGRHGWSEWDNMGIDAALATQLEAQFTDFRSVFADEDSYHGAPMGIANPDKQMDFEDYYDDPSLSEEDMRMWLEILDTIIAGFRNYRLNSENDWKITDPKEYTKAQDIAHERVKESFRLMGEYFPYFWY